MMTRPIKASNAARWVLTLCAVPVLTILSQAPGLALGSHPPEEKSAQHQQIGGSLSEALGSQKPPPEAANLESVLYQLVQADDREAFAKQRAIELVGGKVRVIIELQDGYDFSEDSEIIIESRYENLLQVVLGIDQLLSTSKREDVAFVRLPYRLIPHER